MTFTGDLPAELRLAVGETARIPLTGAMGAGNTWSVTVVADQVPGAGPGAGEASSAAAVAARILIGPPPPPPARAPAGAPGDGDDGNAGPSQPPASWSATETLEIAGQRPGRAQIQLRLGRSWEPRALAEHSITVEVG